MINKLSKLDSSEGNGKHIMLNSFVVVIMLIEVFLFIYKLSTEQVFSKAKYFFGFKLENQVMNMIVGIFIEIYFHLCKILPMYTFLILYATVCLQLTNVIRRFSKSMSANVNCDYEKLLNSFMSLKSTLEYVDDLLSFPLFISTIYFSTVMYFALCVVLQLYHYQEFGLFFCTLSLFVAATISASTVADATSEIGTLAWTLRDSRNNSSYVKQKFLMCTQKKVTLTVWKLISVRRNFSIGIIGAIFTYIMLFYGLEN